LLLAARFDSIMASPYTLPQVAALVRIAQARLELGVSMLEYVDTIRHLASAIQAAESPSVADIALEALEITITAPCPDVREREQFVIQVITVIQRWYTRIGEAQFALLRSLSGELGLEGAIRGRELEASSDEHSEWAALRGKRIGMYSLQESALRRAAKVVS